MALGQATNAQCARPAALQAGNGACDQFGAGCRMWECPDAFDLGNGTWAFKWSDQVTSAVHPPGSAINSGCATAADTAGVAASACPVPCWQEGSVSAVPSPSLHIVSWEASLVW